VTAHGVAHLLKTRQRGRTAGPESVPVDFGARRLPVSFDGQTAILQLPSLSEPVRLPPELLELCFAHNVAFRLVPNRPFRNLSPADQDQRPSHISPQAVPLVLVHAASTARTEHTVTKLTEPETTRSGLEVVGGILEIAGMKMHVTEPPNPKPRKAAVVRAEQYSTDLAKAAGVRSGHRVLDMFFGLGFGSMCAAHRAGAKSVCAFERSAHVLQLAAANPSPFPFASLVRVARDADTSQGEPSQKDLIRGLYDPTAWLQRIWRWAGDATLPSPLPLNSDPISAAEGPRVVVHQQDVTKERFWSVLEGQMFDSAIVDPPRWHRPVVQIYAVSFLRRLADHLNPGATVAFYVPNPDAGGHSDQERALANVLRKFPDTLRATGCFSLLPPVTAWPEIFTYRRL